MPATGVDLMKFTAALTTKSGNLLDDVHFRAGMAHSFKKELADRITTRMEEREMTVADAAQKLDCTQADIKRIRKAEVMRFSVEEMVSLARAMGYRVNVRIDVLKAEGRKLH
jgi:predicted XRE-type DNA-binding protein